MKLWGDPSWYRRMWNKIHRNAHKRAIQKNKFDDQALEEKGKQRKGWYW